MSSLCRSISRSGIVLGFTRSGISLACICLLRATGAQAAEVYYQPLVSLTGGWDSNLELAPAGTPKVSSSDAIADLGTLIGIATPTSQTSIKPDVRYEYYPSARDLNRFEASLDLNSQVRYERDKLTVWGRFDRRDDLYAEAPAPNYNPVTPGLPIPQSAGQINPALIRNDTLLLPSYAHDLSPRAEVGISANIENAIFNPADIYHENFTYAQVRPFYGYNYSPRTTLTVGALASTFEARATDSHSNSAGASAEVSHNWSPVFNSSLSVEYQRSRIDAGSPTFLNQSANDWGASLATEYKGLANQFRVNLGRTILPSSAGAIYNTDQAQAQWDHEFTQRLKFTGAVLYLRTLNLIATGANNDTRTFGTGSAAVEWMMTRVWYISGRYTVAWQRYQLFAGTGLNNGVSLQIGYRGLGRQTP